MLKPSKMNLMGRLALHLKNDVALQGEDFTTYMGSFIAAFIRSGMDFVEVAASRDGEEEVLTILIPMNKLIGIEAV